MKGFLLGLTLLLGSRAFAVGGESRASLAPAKQWGAYASIGNPYPTLLGINGAYNIDNHWRASAGYGEVEVTTSLGFDGTSWTQEKMKAQTYAVGGEYLFLESGLRPVVGAHAGYFSVSGNGEFSIQGINKSTGLFYSNVGVDWTNGGGFNLGTGFNVAVLGGSGLNWYGNIGYYF